MIWNGGIITSKNLEISSTLKKIILKVKLSNLPGKTFSMPMIDSTCSIICSESTGLSLRISFQLTKSGGSASLKISPLTSPTTAWRKASMYWEEDWLSLDKDVMMRYCWEKEESVLYFAQSCSKSAHWQPSKPCSYRSRIPVSTYSQYNAIFCWPPKKSIGQSRLSSCSSTSTIYTRATYPSSKRSSTPKVNTSTGQAKRPRAFTSSFRERYPSRPKLPSRINLIHKL